MEREHLLQLIYGVTIIALTALAGLLIRKILRYQRNRLLRKHEGAQVEEQIETQFIMIERLVLPIVFFIGLAIFGGVTNLLMDPKKDDKAYHRGLESTNLKHYRISLCRDFVCSLKGSGKSMQNTLSYK